MVTNSNRQPIANTRRTHSESTAQFHLTRIAGNCWKGTAKEHTGEMGLADAGETRGRMHGKWLRGLCALLYSGIPTRWSESERIVYAW